MSGDQQVDYSLSILRGTDVRDRGRLPAGLLHGTLSGDEIFGRQGWTHTASISELHGEPGFLRLLRQSAQTMSPVEDIKAVSSPGFLSHRPLPIFFSHTTQASHVLVLVKSILELDNVARPWALRRGSTQYS